MRRARYGNGGASFLGTFVTTWTVTKADLFGKVGKCQRACYGALLRPRVPTRETAAQFFRGGDFGVWRLDLASDAFLLGTTSCSTSVGLYPVLLRRRKCEHSIPRAHHILHFVHPLSGANGPQRVATGTQRCQARAAPRRPPRAATHESCSSASRHQAAHSPRQGRACQQ